MPKQKHAEMVSTIQKHMDGGLFKTMLEVMAPRVMDEEIELHLDAVRHVRSSDRHGRRNGGKPPSLKTREGEPGLQVPPSRATEPYTYAFYPRAAYFALPRIGLATAADYFGRVGTTARNAGMNKSRAPMHYSLWPLPIPAMEYQ